ncbi:MAG: SpoIVB peptidase S55 domain-containing protein [Peptostreptococcaceae bacterium]
MGNVVQIDAELNTIIVRNEVDNCPLQVGDCVLKLENQSINNYDDFSSKLQSLPTDHLTSITVSRGGKTLSLKCSKDTLEKVHFNDLISGFATLTYINEDNKKFGAVAHPINLGHYKMIEIKNGLISTTTDVVVNKSTKGNVGSLCAKRNCSIGKFKTNSNYGINGTIDYFDTSNLKKYKVASLNDVKVGKAQVILQNELNECEKYDIEIVNIENQKTPNSKTFKIKVTDKRLLQRTGGIVQGMSGTPIIQGDYIVGAVSHAVENDPALGYGVFIKWMINNK